MKAYLVNAVSILVLFGGLGLHAAEDVHVGDTEGEVRKKLGPPSGVLQVRDRRILMYDRGEVEIFQGEAVEVELMDADVFARQQQEEAERRAAEYLRRETERR